MVVVSWGGVEIWETQLTAGGVKGGAGGAHCCCSPGRVCRKVLSDSSVLEGAAPVLPLIHCGAVDREASPEESPWRQFQPVPASSSQFQPVPASSSAYNTGIFT